MGRAWLSIGVLLLAGVAAAQEGPEVVDAAEDEALPEAATPEAGAPAPSFDAVPAELDAPYGADAYADAEPVIPELPVKKRVVPIYPDELQVLYKEHAIRCEAQVWVDKAGAPKRIAMVDCPDGFHLAALTAMQKWRWAKPSGFVPAEGFLTVARTGFIRKNRVYYPGVTYFRSPERVTADPELDVTLASGKMPRYPRMVNAGDDVCLVEVVVDRTGRTLDPVIDDCAPPYHRELQKVVRSWKWTWREKPGKDDSRTVLAEVVFRL